MADVSALVATLSPTAREELARRLAEAGTAVTATEPVAIIGMGCRFPGGANTPDAYWELLLGGRDAVSEVPGDRWDGDAYYDPDPQAPGKINSRWGGFLRDVTGFDAEYFGIAPREAQAIDPQQRLLLEVAYEALADAGLVAASMRGTSTGVFIGMSSSDYLMLGVQQQSAIDSYTATGNPHSTAVGRLSYLLDLRGPCLAVDTACSSSLVAVHLASQSLRLRECDLALAGGVHLMLTPLGSVALSRWAMLAPDGRCKAFDAAANGFVRGEGCGVVVLKRFSEAVRDGDRVLAVVRGSAVNSDGHSNGLTAPNLAAQGNVIREALTRAAVEGTRVGLVETHGTGTSLGDPIEFDALAQVYGTGEGRCALGAVKTNMGHLEAAAGIAGLIKAVLAVRHGTIPPNLHFHRWNPAIEPEQTRLFVPTEVEDWPMAAGPRLAGVSSFGFGGTNAHLILEEAPTPRGGCGAVWVFSGQGSQWPGMGQRLLDEDAPFLAAIDELEPVCVAEAGFSLRDVIATGAEVTGIHRVQPVLFGIQVALAAARRAVAGEPIAVIGHSMGEVAAAVVAGALSPADGMRVIARRSRLLRTITGNGAMAVVDSGVEPPEGVAVAVYSSPHHVVVSGVIDAVETLVERLSVQGRYARLIKVDVASHSPQVDPLLAELAAALAEIRPKEPHVHFYSTVYDQSGHDQPAFDAAYWVQNLRRPVRFTQAVSAALADGHRVFTEISPHPVLLEAITNTGGPGVRTTAACVRPLRWNRSPYWLTPARHQLISNLHPLLGAQLALPDGGCVYQADLGTAALPWLADHRVHGVAVLPAAAFVEIALASARHARHWAPDLLTVSDLRLHHMLPLGDSTAITTMVKPVGSDRVRVEVHARQGPGWIRHVTADVTHGQTRPVLLTSPPPADVPESPAGEIYARLRAAGQHHGPAFTAITRVLSRGANVAVAEVELPDDAPVESGFILHPILLDACFQTLSAAVVPSDDPQRGVTYLPMEIGAVRVSGRPLRRGQAHASLRRLDEASWLGTAWLTDHAGEVVAEVTDLYIRRVRRAAVPLPLTRKLFGIEWKAAPLEPVKPGKAAAASWLVLTAAPAGGVARTAAELAEKLSASNDHVVCADLCDEKEIRAALIAAVADQSRPLRGVVLMADSSVPRTSGESHRRGDRTGLGTVLDVARIAMTEELLLGAARAVKVISSLESDVPPRLWFATPVADPAAWALRGLARVLTYEHPQLRATLLEGSTDDVLTEIRASMDDDEVRWGPQGRHVARLAYAHAAGSPDRAVVRAGGRYLVTGGLGGLGLTVARWLAECGASHLVLNGRSAPRAEAHQVITELRGQGTEVDVVLGDIAQPETARRCIAAATRAGATLHGVIHAAAIVEDRTVAALDAENIHRVWAPKALGGWHLHEMTTEQPLDFFALFSSAAALFGSPGQGAYAAANAWLDSFATWRQGQGLPATSINWGPWAEVGIAKDKQDSVLEQITPAEGIEALEALLASQRAVTAVTRLDPDHVLATFPELTRVPLFAPLFADLSGTAIDDWPGPQRLQSVAPDQARQMVSARLRTRIAATMGFTPERLKNEVPLTGLGLDSLMAVRIRNTIDHDFAITMPIAFILQGASLDELSREVCTRLSCAAPQIQLEVPESVERGRQRATTRRHAHARRRNLP
ncbi:MAG: type I polyketide synthase [Pseudonocardiaceae bacterium]